MLQNRNLILFDQDVQLYRQSIYRYFHQEFRKWGYNIIVVYDKNKNEIDPRDGLFIGIDYSFFNFVNIIKKYNCKTVIQFVWLKYLFSLPIIIYNRLNGVKTIVWSHGINLQNIHQPIKNILYYLRQYLASALIIYSPMQKQYIKASHKKLFIANNTLHFAALPAVTITKEILKSKYDLENRKVLLSVGRFDTNNRKVKQLIELAPTLEDDYEIIIIGSGVDEDEISQMKTMSNITYLGPIYDDKTICEYYKLSDLFIMPGAIGLAVNQAFYYGTPVVVEDVPQGPESYYLKNQMNGLYYDEGNIQDLKNRIDTIMKSEDIYQKYSNNAKNVIQKQGSINIMLKGFEEAIKYVNN